MVLNTRKKLWLIIFLGALLRFWFVFNSNHLFHPDELFQTLEPAHRLAFGYGIITWDYRYGLRSYVLPFLLSLPLKTLLVLHLDRPAIYVPLIKILLSLFSLGLIPAAFTLTRKITRSVDTGLLAAFTMAIWYELIYFSPRALTEVIAVHLFALAILCLLRRQPKLLLAGILIGSAVLLRIQYILVLPWFFYRRSSRIWLGLSLAILLFGLSDRITYGTFLISQFNNLKISFIGGISNLFGNEPWWYYFYTLSLTGFGLWWGSIALIHLKKVRPYLFLFGSVLFLHSLIPHKEYRFIFLLIPLGLVLGVVGLAHLFRRSASSSILIIAGLVGLISFLGFNHRLPYESQIYGQPLLLQDPVLNLEMNLPSLPDCALNIPDRNWVYAGGYYFLHQPRPLFSRDFPPPPSTLVNRLILPGYTPPPAGFIKQTQSAPYTLYLPIGVFHHPGYILYTQGIICSPVSSINYDRQNLQLQIPLSRFTPYKKVP